MYIATGITRRTVVLAWTITIVTLAVFVAVTIPEQQRDLREELQSKASGVAVALQGEVAEAAISEDYSSVVEHAMQVIDGDKSVDFLIITKGDGMAVIVERTGWHMEPAIDSYWDPRKRVPSSELGIVPMFNRRVFHYAVPFDYSGIQWGWIHVGLSLDSYDKNTKLVNLRTGILTVICVLISLAASIVYARRFVRPILQLQAAVEQVAAGDLTARANIRSNDEIEHLAHAFNSMADLILHRDEELSERKRDLELRVAERTQELREQVAAKDIAMAELAVAQSRLIDLSRISGMAEVATGVLHNVGNVLNSVNVSATIVADHLHEMRISQMSEMVRELAEHKSDLEEFVANDHRGKRVLPYMGKLTQHLELEREQLGKEIGTLAQHIGHIKEIVAMQQTYARSSGWYEEVELAELIHDVVNITSLGMDRHGIKLQIQGDKMPLVTTDRHKVLQIMLNLIRNAKDSLKESDVPERRITVRMELLNDDRVAIRVADNGIGIPPPNLVKIFSHGFTTKREGHGFGLHSGALAAKQLDGSLSVESGGTGTGATFTLEIPINAGPRAEERMAS